MFYNWAASKNMFQVFVFVAQANDDAQAEE